MITKKVVAIAAAAAVLAVGVGAYAMASAFGGGPGHGHGRGGGFFLLARAAGISRSDIRTAFQNDAAQLQTDRTALKTDRENLVNCLVSNSSSSGCSSQVTALVKAKQTAETDKLMLWEGLFASAPSKANAAKLLSGLQQLQPEEQQLRTQRKQLFQQVFGSNAGSSDAPSDAPTN